MHVSMFVARFLPATGGIVNYIIYLVLGLMRYGIDVEVHVDNIIKISNKEKVNISALRNKTFLGKITLIPEITLIPSLHLRLVKITKTDVINVHGHAEFFTPPTLIQLARLRKPIVLTTHGSLLASLHRVSVLEYSRILNAMGIKLKCKIARSASIKLIDKYVDTIITPLRLEKKALVALGITPQKIMIVRNFIPDNYFEYKLWNSENLLEQYCLEPRRYIITVARIDHNKSLYQVIKAMVNLRNQGVSIKYVIIGPDEGALQNCLSIARKHGLEKSIVYLGTVHDKEVILALERHALAFVLPSYVEGAQPLSALEAMSQRTPIIISSTANFISETVQHMFNGLVFNYGDIHSLTQAIGILLEDESLCKKLGENAFMYAYEYHRLSKAVEKYVEIYKTLHEDL